MSFLFFLQLVELLEGLDFLILLDLFQHGGETDTGLGRLDHLHCSVILAKSASPITECACQDRGQRQSLLRRGTGARLRRR